MYIHYIYTVHACMIYIYIYIYIHSIYYNILYIYGSVADHRRSSPMESAKSLDASGTAYWACSPDTADAAGTMDKCHGYWYLADEFSPVIVIAKKLWIQWDLLWFIDDVRNTGSCRRDIGLDSGQTSRGMYQQRDHETSYQMKILAKRKISLNKHRKSSSSPSPSPSSSSPAAATASESSTHIITYHHIASHIITYHHIASHIIT